MTPIREAARLIDSASKIAVAAHYSPDPDALGSTLAVGYGLRQLNKSVLMLNDDSVPSDLQFLPTWGDIVSKVPSTFKPDLLIVLDCGDTDRVGKVGESVLDGQTQVINIDHHVTNTYFGDVNIVIPECASTTEILLRIFDALNVQLDDDIALCLYTGLVGDTINFSTSSVTPATLRAAARLMEYDIDHVMVNDVLFNRRSFDQLRVWGIGIQNTTLEEGVIWSVIPYTAQKENGISETSLSRLSSLLISVEEAVIAATFRQEKNGEVKMSFRARPGFDVATPAVELGGGGHTLAAGARISGELDSVIERTVGLLKAQAKIGLSESERPA